MVHPWTRRALDKLPQIPRWHEIRDAPRSCCMIVLAHTWAFYGGIAMFAVLVGTFFVLTRKLL